jgi:hypothetical protein
MFRVRVRKQELVQIARFTIKISPLRFVKYSNEKGILSPFSSSCSVSRLIFETCILFKAILLVFLSEFSLNHGMKKGQKTANHSVLIDRKKQGLKTLAIPNRWVCSIELTHF